MPVVRFAAIVESDPSAPSVADVVLMPVSIPDTVVEPAGTNWIEPDISQSPAVREALVQFALVLFVSEVPLVEFVTYSPTLPALALLLVVVPTMPAVWEGVYAPLDARVVNEPARALPVMAELTIAVVAICVVFVVAAAVGAAGTPVKVGDAKVAYVTVSVLQPNPVPLSQVTALAFPLQLGIA